MPAAHRAAAATGAAPDTIQCFKPGRHVALSGAMLAFAAADLAATARAYDPALHEAPLVVGHPTTDGPAYGWVASLAHEAGALEASPRQVNAQFARMVNDGAFKKVSCAFWSPDAPGNPVPGVYYLRHIGFLGAVAPGVEGLRTPQFAGGDEGVVEFSAWADADAAGLWRNLRDWMLAQFGQEIADRVLPAYLVGSVERDAQRELDKPDESAGGTPAAPAPIPAFAAAPAAPTVGRIGHVPVQIPPAPPAPPRAQPAPKETATVDEATAQALQAENATLKQQLEQQQAGARAQRLAAAHDEAVAFAQGLVAQTRLAVADVDLVVATFDALAAQAEQAGATLQFAQGDKQVALLPAVKSLLSALPARSTLQRVATTGAAADAQAADEGSLAGSTAKRRAAIAAMFPDLPAGT